VTERLLEYFQRHAGPDGLAFASETRLIEKFEAAHDELADALRQLESQGHVRILSSLPFVALKLRVWSGSSSHRVARTQQISSPPSSVHSEVPVSSRAAAATQQEDGGAGEGERLLDHVLATLGPEADRDEFRTILIGYDPALIHRCLRRVQATKAIRVSRAALFRSLLHKLSS
jgi:hypothetical protein